ncbi:MAG: autotransporter outer membrane beta-barrel domain-containing protein [Pseudomonas sp.]
MAAGDALPALNLWTSAADEDTDQRFGNVAGNTTKNDFDIQNYIVGADFGLSPALILGASLAIDKGDISGISTAVGAEENELSSSGFMLAPYLGWQLNEQWALDASVGIGEGELDASDSSRQDVDRWYAGANLNYQRWLGSWQFSGRFSYLHAEESYDDIRLRGETQQQLGGLQKLQDSDATNELDRIQLGGQVGYWWNGWLPYAGLHYMDDVHRSTTQDFAPSDPIGREAWIWALGVNYLSLAHGVSAGLAYEQEEGRGNQDLNTWMANLNLRF